MINRLYCLNVQRELLAQALAQSIRPALPTGWDLRSTRTSPGNVGDPRSVFSPPGDLVLVGPDGEESIWLYDLGGTESSDPIVQEAWTVLDEVQDAIGHLAREPWPNSSPGAVPERMAAVTGHFLELWFEVGGIEVLRLAPIELS